MKTNKLSFSLLVLGLALSCATSAQGVYFGVGGGYGFSAAKDQLGPDSKTTIAAASSSTTYTSKTFSLGKGVSFGAYGGYMVNKNIGAELGIGYLIGGKTVTTNEVVSPTPGQSYTSTGTLKSSMLRLTPAIRIEAGEGTIRPYGVIGLIIGLAPKATMESDSAGVHDQITTYSGRTSWGFHGAIGVKYAVNDKIGIFAELSGNYQSWAPGKGVTTTDTYNGKDQLANQTTYQKETDFSSSYTTNGGSGVATNTAVPRQSSLFYLPFSSMGFNVGVHISLGN
jgi:outer membrane protein W